MFIVIQNINNGNFLVNHFGDDCDMWENEVRLDLRSRGSLSYVIFYFDHAINLPPGVDRTQYRLPYHKSWGTINVVYDTRQGEYDFNPFVFDVGALGVSFCHTFQYLTAHVPMLAPFLDRMTTRNLAFHFTASEALSFLEELVSDLSDDELNREIEPKDFFCLTAYDQYDRWAHVTPEFATKWEHYREPPIRWKTAVLRRVCQTFLGCHAVPYTRRFYVPNILSLSSQATMFKSGKAKELSL